MLSSTMRKLFSTILSVLCYMTLSAAPRLVKGIVLDPDENTCYDYDSNTFKLFMGYGLYSDANDYNEDVLVLELQD